MFSTVLMPVTIFRSFVIVYLKREKDLLFLSSLSSFFLIFRQDCRASGVRPLRVLGFRTARSDHRPLTLILRGIDPPLRWR